MLCYLLLACMNLLLAVVNMVNMPFIMYVGVNEITGEYSCSLWQLSGKWYNIHHFSDAYPVLRVVSGFTTKTLLSIFFLM